MYAFPDCHAPAIYAADARVIEAVSRIRIAARVRTLPDHGDRVQDNGRARTWRERLNRAAFAARSRVTLESLDMIERRALAARAVRCEVYAERNGFGGRAVFH